MQEEMQEEASRLGSQRERERQATTRLVGWAKFFAKLAAQRRRLVGWVGKGKKGRRAAAGLAWRNECKRLLVGWGHRGWLAKGKKAKEKCKRLHYY